MTLKSKIFAKICQYISKKREKSGIYKDIAKHLLIHIEEGKLVDVGTGVGLLLHEINKQNPRIQLFGLDISEDACKLARRNLEEVEVASEIINKTLVEASFKENFFDIITCTASFSYWENQTESLKEFYRVLRPNGKVILFEPYKDVNLDKLVKSIKTSLSEASRIRRFFAIRLNKSAIKRGKLFGLKLCTIQEFENLFQESPFKNSYSIKETPIAGFHVFVKMVLEKKPEEI